jgi:hypothetical protein
VPPSSSGHAARPLWLLRAGSQTVVQSCIASIGALPAVPDLRDAVLCSVPPAARSISPMQRVSRTADGSRDASSRLPSGFGWLPFLASLVASLSFDGALVHAHYTPRNSTNHGPCAPKHRELGFPRPRCTPAHQKRLERTARVPATHISHAVARRTPSIAKFSYSYVLG